MDYKLTKEQEQFQKEFKAFCEAEIAPGAAAVDSAGDFPMENWKKLAARGIQGLMIPKEYGGQGGCLIIGVTAIDALASACGSTAMAVGTSMFCGAKAIEAHATPVVKEKVLKALATGEAICAFAVTEPGCGSDVAAITTTAERKGDSFVINGTKSYLTNAPVADYIVVVAKSGEVDGKPKFSVLLVPKGTPGITIGESYKTMGLRGALAASVKFENCEVPAENLLGAENEGFKIVMDSMDYARLNVAAVSNGISSAAFFAAKKYSENRVAFGKPIALHQDIAFRVADMHVECDVARMQTYQAAWMKKEGMKCSPTIAIAKVAASEAAVANAGRAVTVFAGHGYMQGSAVERIFRDAKLMEAAAGTNDILRGIIAADALRD
ncbi:MAG: acyl-CoA dehydrogenase family protein [bacterium]